MEVPSREEIIEILRKVLRSNAYLLIPETIEVFSVRGFEVTENDLKNAIATVEDIDIGATGNTYRLSLIQKVPKPVIEEDTVVENPAKEGDAKRLAQTSDDGAILNYIREHGPSLASVIGAELGLNARSVGQRLAQLYKQGKVENKGNAAVARWILAEQAAIEGGDLPVKQRKAIKKAGRNPLPQTEAKRPDLPTYVAKMYEVASDLLQIEGASTRGQIELCIPSLTGTRMQVRFRDGDGNEMWIDPVSALRVRFFFSSDPSGWLMTKGCAEYSVNLGQKWHKTFPGLCFEVEG